MTSLRDAAVRNAFVKRINQLSPQSQRQWGGMNVSEMTAHLGLVFRACFGEIEMRQYKTIMRFAPIRFLLLYVIPWPKGRAKAPKEVLVPSANDLDGDQKILVELVDRFVETPLSQLTTPHPLFGKMNAGRWDALHQKHLDHHLRQFGV